MKKTFNLDEKLRKEAKELVGAATYTETIRQGLEMLVRDAAYRRLRSYLGTESYSPDVPRRRERPSRKRKVA